MVYDKKTIFEEIIMAASPRTWLMSYTLFCFCTIFFDLVSLSIYDNILRSGPLPALLPFNFAKLSSCQYHKGILFDLFTSFFRTVYKCLNFFFFSPNFPCGLSQRRHFMFKMFWIRMFARIYLTFDVIEHIRHWLHLWQLTNLTFDSHMIRNLYWWCV